MAEEHSSQTQRCAICGGPTIWDPTFPPGAKEPEGSFYCEKCHVWTAPPDGKEAERRQRFVDLVLPIVISILKSQDMDVA